VQDAAVTNPQTGDGSRIHVLWAIDHVCYDGSLHGGGRLFWNLLPLFDAQAFRIVPCLLRAAPAIRELFRDSPTPVRILDKGKFDPTTLWTFLRLIRSERLDVLHLHCYACSSFGRLAGWIAGVPSVIHDYDTEVYFPYPAYLGLADRLLAPRTAQGLAASPMVRRFMVEKRKLAEERVRMMFHGVPPEKYRPVPQERLHAARERHGVPPGRPTVCCVTKLGPQRGNELLLEVAARVVKRQPDALFLLIYKPTHFHRQPDKRYVPADHEATVERLRELARSLGLEDRVRFIEEGDGVDVDALISASDLFAAPFLSERFSSVGLLEAMALGTPVVASALGEQREFIDSGVNGYLVPPGDAERLTSTLCELLGDAAGRRRLAQAARQAAEAYSAESYVRALEDLYTRLAARGSAGGVGRNRA
jgi:glycosyltransferase involved in cell wall biosynthesis